MPRWIALITMGLTLALSLQLWYGRTPLTQSARIRSGSLNSTRRGSRVLVSLLGIAIDGLSLLMVVR
ncbi:hypothetical protein ACLB1Q_32615 [Escherichia coli]